MKSSHRDQVWSIKYNVQRATCANDRESNLCECGSACDCVPSRATGNFVCSCTRSPCTCHACSAQVRSSGISL
ncbi:hypothetical protein KP509_13G044100 [Ceratopteris richardii]|uniref:Metallothionein n=1 Tax=Ceratopteris richardii TaxID=49495 RepID=A0A8T2THC0_CERRI|nr:hypothetical protein KP509_13G044100 [Ceratopteris richardii]